MRYFTSPTRFLSILFLTILISSQLSSQTRRAGQLPSIDYSQINPEVYEAGKFRIKFKAVAEKQLETPNQLKSQSGIAVTGIREVDALSQQLDVKNGKALLSDLYNSPLKSATIQTERHKKYGLHLWYEFETGKDVNLAELIQRYKKLESVEIVEPVFKIIPIRPVKNPTRKTGNTGAILQNWVPDDEHFPEQWHYHNTGQYDGREDSDIDLPEAWESIQGNPEVIVAVIDQGVDFNHPDLAGNIWPGIGPEGESTTPGDHGTHVAGTIAAINNNGIGVSGIAGGSGNNDGVRIMSLDLFNGQHGMSTLEMNVWAADNGAAISQNSWGYMAPDYYNQSDIDGINYFNEHGGGDVMDGGITFFAAGNDNDAGDWYPGCYEGAISVAATNNSDQRSWYSNYGDWVDISAPGGETSSTYEAGILSTVTNGGYNFYQGTSMACPHVSGVAALVLSLAPGFLTNEELASILLTSADNHYTSNPGYEGMMGTGRLNAFNAIEMTQEYLGSIRNPFSFAARAISENSIQLTWELNDNADHVMIAISKDGNFGSPENASSYNIGDELPEGGVIHYVGNNLTTEITDLKRNTTYYFRIWSFDANKEYSYGRSAQTKTFSPQIDLSAEIIDYGTTYLGYPENFILEIKNDGESDLALSEIAFSNDNFSSSEDPTVIPSGSSHDWEIISNSTHTGSHTGTLSFTTNAPGKERISLSLFTHVSDLIPSLEYAPSEIEETLHSGSSKTRFIELSNTGDGDMRFSIVKQEISTTELTAPKTPIAGSPVPAIKDQLKPRSYENREMKESGGSEDAAFFWETTTHDWIDISDGTELYLEDDDSKNVPLGFNFNYFDSSFNSINIKSNGWVSFTNNSDWFPACIPEEGGAICPFGEDLDPDTDSKIRYKTIGNQPSRKFVIEYNNIKLYNSSVRNTFQIVLTESFNTILFQYSTMESTPISLGIENYDGSAGIGNCGIEETFINPEIITSNLSIQFRPDEVLSIFPPSGLIMSGQSKTVSVDINAEGLVENTYYWDLIIAHNDPRQKEVAIPITLNILGAPDLQTNTDTISMSPTFWGTTSQKSFILDNTKGNKGLTISNIAISGPPFSIGSWPETVPPGEQEAIELFFSPEQGNYVEGSFTIFSDDPDTPEKTIYIVGEGIIPPEVEATPDQFNVELYSGTSEQKRLTITNKAANSRSLDVMLQIEATTEPEPVSETEAQLIPGVPTQLKSLFPVPNYMASETSETVVKPKSNTGHNILFLTSLGTSNYDFHHSVAALSNVSHIDSIDITRQTPNTSYLLLYDMVLMATNTPMVNPTILGDMLADYIDMGGKLCLLNGAFSDGGGWTIRGRITNEAYLPLSINEYTFTPSSCTNFTEHPLTKDLTILTAGTYSFSHPQGTGVSLGSYDSGYSCLAYNTQKPIVAINMFPVGEHYNDELLILMENTIDWLSGASQWLSADEAYLSIEQEESRDVALTFNASGLQQGTYQGNILVKSNDPITPELTIPATLKVIDAPHLTIDNSAFNFEKIPIGIKTTRAREISNTGTIPLEIASLDISGEHFECSETTPVTLDPGETKHLDISFNPQDTADISGQLTIISNDPTKPEVKIDLTGSGYHAPVMNINPLKLEEQIFEGENISKTITINNEGIGEALTYSIALNYGNNATDIGGGPDDGNYSWNIVEHDPTDLSQATEIPLNDDDCALDIPLGFDFSYYNEKFSSVNIMSNGWISFTDYDSWFPDCIPASYGAIAPNPRDLNTYEGQSIRYATNGEAPNRKFIIDYYTSILNGTEPEHFQIILEETTNKIKFQYPYITTSPLSVGISSPDGTTGIGSCANDSLFIPTDLVTSGTAIAFSDTTENWLSVTPGRGSIEKSGQTDIEVLMPTTNMPAGTYKATLVVEHNDPMKLPLSIPVILTIDELKKYSLTFNYQNQFAEQLEDVTISFNGQPELKGVSQFTNLNKGVYQYSASKEGYSQGANASGQVTIENSDLSLDVILIALLQSIELQAYPPGSGHFNGSQNYYTNQRVYLEALPESGFHFHNWTDQNNNILSEQAGYSFTMPPHNLSLTGNFGLFSSLVTIKNVGVSVFPNPAKDVIHVNIPNPEKIQIIEVITPEGQILKHAKPNKNGITTIDIRELSSGTYILKVSGKQEASSFKFVKK
jgi:hypothetical protein